MTLLEIIPIGVAIVGLGLRCYVLRHTVPAVHAPKVTAVVPARKRHTQRVASRASRGQATA